MKNTLKSLLVAVLIQASAMATVAITATPSSSNTVETVTEQKQEPKKEKAEGRNVRQWTPSRSRSYVRNHLKKVGWGAKQFKCADKIVYLESRWSHTSDNKYSSAYGLFQILRTKPGTPVPKQTDAFIRYVKHRYGNPCKAWEFHKKHNWY